MSTTNKRNLCSTMRADKFSNLPPEITVRILENLPLADAVRTSTLSRYWRTKWVHISQLILDHHFFISIVENSSTTNIIEELTNAVNSIFSRLVGPIRKFELYIFSWLEGAELDRWVKFVSGKGVKEFTLIDCRQPGKTLPPSLFSCVGLTQLTLVNCSLHSLPLSFQGFPCLVNFEFLVNRQGSHAEEPVLEDFVSMHCPQLNRLRLIGGWCFGITIHAPKLEDLVLVGVSPYIIFEGVTKIKRLELYLPWVLRMQEIFSSLTFMEKLTLSDLFWMLNGHCEVRPPATLANELVQLAHLELIRLPLNCPFAVSAVLCLFQSSPRLTHLSIRASSCRSCSDKPHKMVEECTFPSIKTVKLSWISGLTTELQFIKFLLATTPMLEVMTIEINEDAKPELLSFVEELKQFPCGCASKNAKILLNLITNKDIVDCQ
ncbi:hypothetical protein RDABS01_032264 [Bienertia sinuspersici]